MDLDIWRYVTTGRGKDSRHRGYRLYSIVDMGLLHLPDNWWYYLDEHGEGHAIEPPFKVRSFISWTPSTNMVVKGKLQQGLRMPQEKLCIDILKRSCNTENLFSLGWSIIASKQYIIII